MRAIVVNADQSLSWREVAPPEPEDSQIMIEVHASAVNRADLMQRAGNYPPPPDWPQWMGLEAAGVVKSAPPDSRWQPGDQVCALLGGGGYAEQVALPPELACALPKGLSMQEAASLPEAYATAWLNLRIEAELQAGETVFIQAGASGLGIAAIQLAKLLGAKVITSVGGAHKTEFVQALGADVIIDHHKQSIAEVLAENPVDVALDCVAGPQLGECLKSMKHNGRWVIIATLGGAISEINMNEFFRRGTRLIGSTLRSRSNALKGEIMAALEKQVWPAFSEGRLKPCLHAVLPISEAEQAHDILQRRQNLGKVVLTVK